MKRRKNNLDADDADKIRIYIRVICVNSFRLKLVRVLASAVQVLTPD